MGCAAAMMTGAEHVTVGPPIANTVFYVADLFGNELPAGMRGELIICGDQVGRGYVNLPEKSAAAFFTHDGMRAYHSGDLAAWTEEGEIRIFGRLDNQIKLRGFRIELDAQVIADDLFGVERIAGHDKTSPDPVHEPFTVKRRNIRAAAGIQDHRLSPFRKPNKQIKVPSNDTAKPTHKVKETPIVSYILPAKKPASMAPTSVIV